MNVLCLRLPLPLPLRHAAQECLLPLACLAFAAALLIGCKTETPPEADLQVTAQPMPLIGRPEKVVDTYLQQFPSYHSQNKGQLRVLTIRDHGRTLSVEVAGGQCQSVRISGRLGDSLFPRSPGDLPELRDAYAGHIPWQVTKRSGSSSAPDSLTGRYDWVSTDPPLQASATWTYDSTNRQIANYELTIRKN
jgi:hypothetical protein